MRKPPRVFLSSTYEDLASYRDEVMRALSGCEVIFKGMEHFGASQGAPLEICLKQIEDSDLVICLLGTRYGSCPEGSSISYTEHEIEHALKLKRPIHVYLLDEDNQPVLKKHVDIGKNADRLERLKARVKNKFTVKFFSEPKDLAMIISLDLFKGNDLSDFTPASIRAMRGYRECAYDLLAEWYDSWYIGHWNHDEPYKTICSIVSTYLESQRGMNREKKILDSACGTGNTFSIFTREGFDIYGTDGSREMLLFAEANCKSVNISTEKLILEPINWTNMEAYLKHFRLESFDLILNTANSFCHIPPISEYMQTALANFRQLLKPGGLLLIDTKRYIRSDPVNEVPTYKELRYDASEKEWMERFERQEDGDVPGIGKVYFHTRLMYDTDPSFSRAVRRALIILTIYGENMAPRTLVVPYYPLPSYELKTEMIKAGFKATIFPALEGPTGNWKYDVVVGQKLA
jgi:SAM-dependent methyltransferase